MAEKIFSLSKRHGRFGFTIAGLFKNRVRTLTHEMLKASLDTLNLMNKQCTINIKNELPKGISLRLRSYPIYPGVWQTHPDELVTISSGTERFFRARKVFGLPTGCSGMLCFNVICGKTRANYFVAIAFRNQFTQARKSARNKIAVAILPFTYTDRLDLYHKMIDHWDKKSKDECPSVGVYDTALAKEGFATVRNDEIEVVCLMDTKNDAEVVATFSKLLPMADNCVKHDFDCN